MTWIRVTAQGTRLVCDAGGRRSGRPTVSCLAANNRPSGATFEGRVGLIRAEQVFAEIEDSLRTRRARESRRLFASGPGRADFRHAVAWVPRRPAPAQGQLGMKLRARMVAMPRMLAPRFWSCMRTMVWFVAMVGAKVGTASAYTTNS